jgi:hypothetical protein
MLNVSKMLRVLCISLAAFGFLVINGIWSETYAQTRDPFEKPGWAKPKNPNPPANPNAPKPGTTTNTPPKPAAPTVVMPPDIQARINFYKRLREDAAANGQELPKVTTVLTLDEMAVNGIFRTPRGYAAMVEAKPIKLSYTIYPGEKFFDGQLVAIEENRLVFRKVTKMSNGKFLSSVENKPLRQYTMQETVQGTAPTEPSGKTETAEKTETAPAEKDAKPEVSAENVAKPATPTVIVSPLDEMNRQPQEPAKDAKKESAKEKPEKPGKKDKKPVKVAKNKKQ